MGKINKNENRREFIKSTALASAGITLASSAITSAVNAKPGSSRNSRFKWWPEGGYRVLRRFRNLAKVRSRGRESCS